MWISNHNFRRRCFRCGGSRRAPLKEFLNRTRNLRLAALPSGYRVRLDGELLGEGRLGKTEAFPDASQVIRLHIIRYSSFPYSKQSRPLSLFSRDLAHL